MHNPVHKFPLALENQSALARRIEHRINDSRRVLDDAIMIEYTPQTLFWALEDDGGPPVTIKQIRNVLGADVLRVEPPPPPELDERQRAANRKYYIKSRAKRAGESIEKAK